MTRLNRFLVAALVLQGGALALVRLVGRGGAAEPAVKLFEKLDPKQVASVRITDADKKVVELRRQGAEWVLASAGDYPVRPGKVAEFLGKLPGLLAGAPVASSEAHHRALEVAKDTFQREVALTGGGAPVRFYLGSSPAVRRVHLRRAGEDAVYAVRDLSAWDASAVAADWVDADYFKVERDKLVSVTLRNAHGTLTLRREGAPGGEAEEGAAAASRWTLDGLEEGARVKSSEVDALLGALAQVTLQEPVGKHVLPAYGLTPPKGEALLVVREGGREKTHRLQVGAKEGEGHYAKSASSSFVVKVGTWTADAVLQKKAQDFQTKEPEKTPDKGPPGGGAPAMPEPDDEP
ncbi:MAG: DUF4340 domain-containing protein [Deltaproteobacteria bacterium]|nr:DUF4340 domain-containing protein [Deltaproteobacteria bacterium]